MQQGGGGGRGGGGSRSQYGLSPEITPPMATATAALNTAHVLVQQQQQQQQEQLVEAASPISSRPPAAATMGNFEQLLPLSVGEDAGDEADRGGGSGGGNRWPRQETLALLKIRSEMDAAFRDATVKGPLWEGVSRKLEEQGYKRSAKKCKEKFENVHKYYKRTKEGRAGRQDGKYYKFFSELEALQGAPAAAAAAAATTIVMPNLVVPPVSGGSIGISNPMPISSVRIPASVSAMPPQAPFPDLSGAMAATSVRGSPAVPPPQPPPVAPPPTIPISFSSNSSSSLPGSEEEEDDEDLDPSNTAGSSRKRKRGSSTRGISSDSRRMMEFFEGLMKQVMQKQEAMQHRFLEAIEKREQDRMIREEAWRRQEIGRLTREQELMAQERALSASRDEAIISFLQKITGQTIVLPSPVAINIPPAQPPPPPPPSTPLAPVTTVATPAPAPAPAPSQQQQLQQHHQHQQQQQLVRHQQSQNVEVVRHHQLPISSEVVLAVPEQQVQLQEMSSGGGSLEPISSRWPKVEVLALIKLRSGLESRYQDTVPKGPLWEEISAGMQRMGYNRNAKRCKEKWENINKYFKKVKESNKKRPEDAKTCPYFHELDALYRKKMIGSSSGGGAGGSSSFLNQNRLEQQQQGEENQQGSNVLTIMPKTQSTQATEIENKSGSNADAQASNAGLPASFIGEGSGGAAAKKPEDIVKELMEQQQHPHHQQRQAQLIVSDYDKIEEHDHSDIGIDQEGDEDEDEDDYEEELEEESEKMAYKIEFQQRQKAAGPSNGGAGNGAPSFLAMVQ